ncbi:hypothetical protein B0H10DRAFT_2215337 [Mycena sp. CBHHK59/15]|nr:hypothetical protein B0H10DRAFT_2215337 [Mycena sp. CBHHK59/15]
MTEKQVALSAAFSTPSSAVNRVLAINGEMQCRQSLSPLETNCNFLEELEIVAPMVEACAENPIHFNVDSWVRKGVLVEDQGQIIAENVARLYVCVTTIPSKDAALLRDFMAWHPADIAWSVLMLLIHGATVEEAEEAA